MLRFPVDKDIFVKLFLHRFGFKMRGRETRNTSAKTAVEVAEEYRDPLSALRTRLTSTSPFPPFTRRAAGAGLAAGNQDHGLVHTRQVGIYSL